MCDNLGSVADTQSSLNVTGCDKQKITRCRSIVQMVVIDLTALEDRLGP